MLIGVYAFLCYQHAQEKACLWFAEDGLEDDFTVCTHLQHANPHCSSGSLPKSQEANEIPSFEVRRLFFLHVYAILCQGDDGILPF